MKRSSDITRIPTANPGPGGRRRLLISAFLGQAEVFLLIGKNSDAKESARRACAAAVGNSERGLRAQALLLEARACGTLCDLLHMKEAAGNALNIFSRIGDRHGKANALSAIGTFYFHHNDLKKAGYYYKRALSVFSRCRDVEGRALVLSNIGCICFARGEYEKAAGLFEKTLELAERKGSAADLADFYIQAALPYRAVGKYRRSLHLLDNALAVARRIGARTKEGIAANNIANFYYYLKDYTKMEEYAFLSLNIFAEIDDPKNRAYAHLTLGNCYQKTKRCGLSEHHYKECSRLGKITEDVSLTGKAENNLGNLFYIQNDLLKAKRHYLKALTVFLRTGDEPGVADVYNNLGSIKAEQGNKREAIAFYLKAAGLYGKLGDIPFLAGAYRNTAAIYSELHDSEKEKYYREKAVLAERDGRI